MFFAYESESQMREIIPSILADHLIQIAKKEQISVCSRGKQCTGSIDGKEYMYADGSKDFGETITICRASFQNNVYRWEEHSS